MVAEVRGDVGPSGLARDRTADDADDGHGVARPGLEVRAIRVDVEAAAADVRRATLDLYQDEVAARLAILGEQLDRPIDAEVGVLERAIDAAGRRRDLPEERHALVARLRRLRILRSHRVAARYQAGPRWST